MMVQAPVSAFAGESKHDLVDQETPVVTPAALMQANPTHSPPVTTPANMLIKPPMTAPVNPPVNDPKMAPVTRHDNAPLVSAPVNADNDHSLEISTPPVPTVPGCAQKNQAEDENANYRSSARGGPLSQTKDFMKFMESATITGGTFNFNINTR